MTNKYVSEASTRWSKKFRWFSVMDLGIVLSFLIIFIFLSLSSSVFLSKRNLLNLLEQQAVVGIIAIGGTLVIIAGGFDLSVGAIYALSGIATAWGVNEYGPVFGILLGLLVGIISGLINGLLTTAVGINPFITTLASSIILRGVSLAVTGGFLVAINLPSFSFIGRGTVFGIKVSILIFLIVALITGLLLSKTVFGRHVYAAGGNPEAARLAGVRVSKIKTWTFVISGLTAAIAGIIVASRSGNGQASIGIGLEFQAIAAIVVGGTSIFGGEGAIWRTVLGVLLLGLISNGFTLLSVSPTYQQIFEGTIILVAVGTDLWIRKKAKKRG